MKKIEVLRLSSMSRAPLVIHGYFFKGNNPKAPTLAIVGAMEGVSIIPLYTAARLVDFLKQMEESQKIYGDILVIPSINHYALNINERFWPLDKTDINMMFPGYSEGETTQRIAHKVFEAIKGYTYGVSLETRGDLSSCIPYVSLLQSTYEDLPTAKKFGLQVIYHKEMRSTETVSLQYNWQLWGTKACTIVCPSTEAIEDVGSNKVLEALIRFASKTKILRYKMINGYESSIVLKKNVKIIKAPKSGIFIPSKKAGALVVKDEVLGHIINSLEGNVLYEFLSPANGMISCYHKQGLIFEKAVAFRIVKST